MELGVWMAKLVYGSEIRMCGAEPVPQKVDGVSRVYNAIVPVPPSGTKRGYNVPYLMALPLAEATGVPLYENALCRARKKKHQAGLPFYERVANVAGAFRVTDPELVERAALKETSPCAGEIYVMGVLPEYHRSGIGRQLFAAIRAEAIARGYRLLQVKTVQTGHYEEYDRTNAFYQRMGFLPLECLPTLWDEWNPCQVYVLPLQNS